VRVLRLADPMETSSAHRVVVENFASVLDQQLGDRDRVDVVHGRAPEPIAAQHVGAMAEQQEHDRTVATTNCQM